MFSEFQNQVWTNSLTGAIVTDNTDETIDAASKKIVFTESGAWVLSTFTPIDPSSYEEISLQIYIQPTLQRTDIFKLEINGAEYFFQRYNKPGWHHILIDCQDWEDPISTIKITCLTDAIVLFFDLAGTRKVAYDSMDYDIIDAIKSAINLDYAVSTVLTENADVGSSSILLEENPYVNNTTMLQLTDGIVTEMIQLQKSDGTLSDPLVNSYDKDTTVVTALCPVISEEDQRIESDPVCGVFISDTSTFAEDVLVPVKGPNSSIGAKLKKFLGSLQITIYIDCSAKKKFLSLVRQFDDRYGERFYILLDGEKIELYQESNPVTTPDTDLGNLPRKAYFYFLEPQPITVSTKREIETINLNIESEGL